MWDEEQLKLGDGLGDGKVLIILHSAYLASMRYSCGTGRCRARCGLWGILERWCCGMTTGPLLSFRVEMTERMNERNTFVVANVLHEMGVFC